MQKAISITLIVSQILGCSSNVINVQQVKSSKIITLAGNKVEMPKSGCYLDIGHGRICTGNHYKINDDSKWELIGSLDIIDKDNSIDIKSHKIVRIDPEKVTINHNVNSMESNNSKDETLETVVEVIGTVAIFALIFAGTYYGAKGAYHAPLIMPSTINQDVTPIHSATIKQSNMIQNQNPISSIGGDTYKIESTSTNSGDIQMRPSLDPDPSKVYRGSIDQTGSVQLRNLNGDTLRGDIDKTGYGRLTDQNGNSIPVRPN